MRNTLAFIAILTHLIGHAQFGDPRPVHAIPYGPALEAYDLDGDGDPDLIGIVNGVTVMAWINTDGTGTFSEVDTLLLLSQAPDHYVFQDLNGDGAADLLFVTANGSRLAAAWNNGWGQLAAPVVIAQLNSIPGALRVGDITGNGWPDVVVTFSEDDQAGIAYWPNQQGVFSAEVRVANLLSGDAPTVMAIGDLDGSGGQDIFVVASDLAAVGLMNGNGDGTAWDVITFFYNFDYPLIKPQLIDVDGDGDLDLAEANVTSVQWVENRLNDPEGNFKIQLLAPFTSGGMGKFGLLGCNNSAGVVYVPSNPTLPVNWSHHLPEIEGFAPRVVLPDVPRGQYPILADLDGDGRPDLLLVQASGTQWYPNVLTPATTEVTTPEFNTHCIQGPPLELPEVLPTTGAWSGNWVQNGSLYRSNAASSIDVPLDYTLYEEKGCPVGDRSTLSLITGPALTTPLGPVFCSGDGPLELQTQPSNVEWMGIPQTGILDPSTFNGGIIVCAYTDPTSSSCVSFLGPIVVWNSVQASIQPAGPFCTNSGVQNIVPAVILPGTTWSGDILSSTNSAALFDPSQGAGEYTVILDRVPSSPQQCANSDTLLITVVDDIPSVSLTSLPVYCAGGPLVQLYGGLPVGGEWSGAGVMNGDLDPTMVGFGPQPVTYSYTNDAGCTADAVLFVELATNAVVQNTERNFCPEDESVQFIALPAGGTWALPLDVEGFFSPALAGVGSHPLSYTYTAPNGCTLDNTPEQVLVDTPTYVEIDALPMYCLNSEPVFLNGSLAGVWSGAVSGVGSSVNFDPAALGVGTWDVTLTVTPDDGCKGETTISIIVDGCSGIDDNAMASFATVAPNPFLDEFQVVLDRQGTFTMHIVDAMGRTVQSAEFSTFGKSWITVDLTGKASGNYTVLIQSDTALERLRVVKADR